MAFSARNGFLGWPEKTLSGFEQGHSGLDKGPSATEQPFSASDNGMSGPEEPLSALEKPLPGPDKVVSPLQSPFPPRAKLCPGWKRAGLKRRAICPSRTKLRPEHLRPLAALTNPLPDSATPFQTSRDFRLDFRRKTNRAYSERGTRNAERGTRNAERGTQRRTGRALQNEQPDWRDNRHLAGIEISGTVKGKRNFQGPQMLCRKIRDEPWHSATRLWGQRASRSVSWRGGSRSLQQNLWPSF